MKHANEFRIGLWTIISVVVLFVGIKFLKGQLHTSSSYYLVCQDVSGLAESSHVKLNGFRVGLVRAMSYDYNLGQVIVKLNIDPDLRLPEGSSAVIEPDLLGTSNVILSLGHGNGFIAPGDTLLGGGTQPGLVDGVSNLMPSVEGLMPKIDSILTGLNIVVNDSKLQESLLQVNAVAHQLQSTLVQLNAQLPGIMRHAGNAVANLDTLSNDMRNLQLQATLDEANRALAQVNDALSSLNGTDGTAARLINTNELHDQLTHTLADVDSLVADIKQNPKRYINIKVFGK